MTLKVFYTSVSCDIQLKKNQDRIFSILDGQRIKYEAVDIAQDPKIKDLMRELVKNPTALAPQICNGTDYCGDYTAFDNAVEEEQLKKFLKL